MLLFSYQIVPRGGHKGQVAATGNLYIADVERAKRHVQTVTVPNLEGPSDLEVILQDKLGSEIWRGPYLGPDNPERTSR
jgi:hypothetical protein